MPGEHRCPHGILWPHPCRKCEDNVGPPVNSAQLLDELLCEAGARVSFGLRQQGHLPKVREMLANDCSWAEIGRAIGWHGPTVKQHWEWEVWIEVGEKLERARIRQELRDTIFAHVDTYYAGKPVRAVDAEILLAAVDRICLDQEGTSSASTTSSST